MPSYIKKCSICNNDFETKRSHTLYCSTKCSKKEESNRNKDRYEITCQCCGNLFKTSKQQTRLCSHACINITTKKHNEPQLRPQNIRHNVSPRAKPPNRTSRRDLCSCVARGVMKR